MYLKRDASSVMYPQAIPFPLFSNITQTHPGDPAGGDQSPAGQLLTPGSPSLARATWWHQLPVWWPSPPVPGHCTPPRAWKVLNYDNLLGRIGEDGRVWTDGCWGNVVGELQGACQSPLQSAAEPRAPVVVLGRRIVFPATLTNVMFFLGLLTVMAVATISATAFSTWSRLQGLAAPC